MHVVPTYYPATRYGGPIRSVHGLCKALVQAGHELSVFTTNVDGTGDSDVPLGQPVEVDGVRVWYFPSKRLRRLYWAPAMLRALREQVPQYEIVHLHSVFLWPTWAAARAARKAGVPYLVAPRGMLVRELIRRKSRWLKTGWIALVERNNLKRAAGIHVTAPLELVALEEFRFDLPRIYYVPNGIEPLDIAALSGATTPLLPDGPYALFLGRVNWEKGLDRLVEAWRRVPGCLLLIAGNDEEGYGAQIQALAERAGLAGRVRFVGPVSGTDKWLLYRHAEVLVLPSYSENFGIVVLEAMAMGCPVVVTPEVGLAEVVAEAACGRVVKGEPDSLAGAINEMLADRELRTEMGRRGQTMVDDRFLWSSIAQQMEAAYTLVIGQRSATE